MLSLARKKRAAPTGAQPAMLPKNKAEQGRHPSAMFPAEPCRRSQQPAVAYSTVTLFARLRGLSTSQPRSTAM